MGTWNPGDPVVHRTLFYERVRQGDKELVRFLPFYLVRYPGMSGKVFEPVDCLKRRQMANFSANTSAYPKKEIHELREMHGYASLVNCEKSPDGTKMVLHSFGWDWPM